MYRSATAPSEALLALGATPYHRALSSLGMGQDVPGVGWVVMHPDDLVLYADKLLLRHRPDRGAIQWSWRALPKLRTNRRCVLCGKPWLCEYARWAEGIKWMQVAGNAT